MTNASTRFQEMLMEEIVALRQQVADHLAKVAERELSCLLCGQASDDVFIYSANKGCFICRKCVERARGYEEMMNLAASERGLAIAAEAHVSALTAQLATVQERDILLLVLAGLLGRWADLDDLHETQRTIQQVIMLVGELEEGRRR